MTARFHIGLIPSPPARSGFGSGVDRYLHALVAGAEDAVEWVGIDDPQHPRPDLTPTLAPQATASLVSLSARPDKPPARLRLLLGYARDAWRLARVLRPYRDSVDLIHVNRVGCEVQTIAARLAGFKRVVTTIHNLPGDREKNNWALRLVEWLSFACGDIHIAVSEATYEAWHERVGLGKRKKTTDYRHQTSDIRLQTLDLRKEETTDYRLQTLDQEREITEPQRVPLLGGVRGGLGLSLGESGPTPGPSKEGSGPTPDPSKEGSGPTPDPSKEGSGLNHPYPRPSGAASSPRLRSWRSWRASVQTPSSSPRLWSVVCGLWSLLSAALAFTWRKERCVVIYNGMEPVDLSNFDRRAYRAQFCDDPDNTFIIGICARLHKMKGHWVLLEAFARLLQEHGSQNSEFSTQNNDEHSSSPVTRHPSLLLLIAGSGPEEANIRARIADLGIGVYVRLLGHRTDAEQFAASLDLNVLPSVELETLGYSVVEAMFAGVPSIVSDVGGMKEVIGASGGGAVVTAGNVGQLAGALAAYVLSPERRIREGRKAREFAARELTARRMAGLTLEVYEGVGRFVSGQ